LAFEEDCDTHVDLGCGTFRCGEVPPVLPKCLFEDALRVSALRRGI
jgi:hypothetical protein